MLKRTCSMMKKKKKKREDAKGKVQKGLMTLSRKASF